MAEKLLLKEPMIGFFKYDLFPYIVHFEIVGWTESGSPLVGTRSNNIPHNRKSMFHILPKKEGDILADAIDKAKSYERSETSRLRSEILKKLPIKNPELND